jgi:hypothetical protein
MGGGSSRAFVGALWKDLSVSTLLFSLKIMISRSLCNQRWQGDIKRLTRRSRVEKIKIMSE